MLKTCYRCTLIILMVVFTSSLVVAQISSDSLYGFINAKGANIVEGPPPVVKASEKFDDIPTANKDTGDFNIDGGSVIIDPARKGSGGYTGKVNIKDGVIRTNELLIENGKVSKEVPLEYRIKNGKAEFKNGRIVSFQGQAEKFEIPNGDYVHTGIGLRLKGEVDYKSENGRELINSKNVEMRGFRKLDKGYDDAIFRLKLKSKKDLDIKIEPIEGDLKEIEFLGQKIKTGDTKKFIIDTKGELADVEFDQGFIYGKLDSKIEGKMDFISDTPGIPLVNVEPSEGRKSAKFKFSDKIFGRVTSRTSLFGMDRNLIEPIPEDFSNIDFYGDEVRIKTADNNQIGMYVNKDKVAKLVQEKIKDNSQVLITPLNSDKKDRIVFNKGAPRTTGQLSNFDSLIGTQFERGGQTYSWELRKGESNPVTDQHNVLYLVSKDFSELNRKELTLPFKTYNEKVGKQVDFLNSLDSYKITNVDRREFSDLDSFVNSLSTPSIAGKYDQVFLSTHGNPTSISITKTKQVISSKDLINLNPEVLKRIRNGIDSTGYCTAASCFLMLNTQKPENRNKFLGGLTNDQKKFILSDKGYAFGPMLSHVLGVPTVGSVPAVSQSTGKGILVPSNKVKRLYSSKWIVAYPDVEKYKVQLSEDPPNFRFILFIIKEIMVMIR